MKKLILKACLILFVMQFAAILCAEDAKTPADPNQPAAEKKVTPPAAKKPVKAIEKKVAPKDKPVKVYILMGQSNMFGFGMVYGDKNGTLQTITKKGKYPNIIDKNGKWVVRKDVRYVHVMQSGKGFELLRNEWLTVGDKYIGPELQIGHILGDYHEEPVLILKACIGNRCLGWDFLPPNSERFEYRGKIIAGYRDVKHSWSKGQEPEGDWKSGDYWYAGKQYDDDTRYAKTVVKNLGKYYPGKKDYEIAGFFYWQGHKDQGDSIWVKRYEVNLVNFIKSLRKDFNAPNAPFSIATIGFGGRRIKGAGLKIVRAQLAVSGDNGKYPEFKGNVKTVDARGFWQPVRRSPSGNGSHYNLNAETYMDVGNGMGNAMVDMLKGKK